MMVNDGINNGINNGITGWWFGTWIKTFHILGISSSQLTNSYFSEG